MKDDCNNDRLIEAWAAYHAHLEANGIAVPTREPKSIDLEAPLLGLGEDYEPEVYAMPFYAAPNPFRAELAVKIFKAEKDVPPHPNLLGCHWVTIEDIKRIPGKETRADLCDAKLNILKTWPL